MPRCTLIGLFAVGIVMGGELTAQPPLKPVPNQLVVLTFDDSVKSHFTVARPILKRHGFNATFFITEGFDFATNKQDYMTWDEIAQLHRDGFEIGNHTRDHMAVTQANLGRLSEQLTAIENKCREHDIPRPVSFAYPGNAFDVGAFEILKKHGIRFARRGGAPEYKYESGRGFAFEPGLDHPLRIPSAGDARPTWQLDDLRQAVEQARHGRIAVLQFHGVPDKAHPWVNTPREKFATYMQYLADNHYQVIAMRDLADYVAAGAIPKDHEGVIRDRQWTMSQGRTRDNFRPPSNDRELHHWLRNMAIDHRFTLAEIGAATGLSESAITAHLEAAKIVPGSPPASVDGLRVLPFPGGRHPRIGFVDGMIRPQRETKISVFLPWQASDYVVADIPEAIWFEPAGGRKLLYLAHTHVPTYWDDQKTELKQLEWNNPAPGKLHFERELPNGVAFGTRVATRRDHVRMEMWLRNGTSKTLTGLRVQNCVMLKNASEFNQQTRDNKKMLDPYIACANKTGDRWIITAWMPVLRSWANVDCPCMHSDPKFPDCPPGETKKLQGWLSFYEGKDIEQEIRRINDLKWWEQPLPTRR